MAQVDIVQGFTLAAETIAQPESFLLILLGTLFGMLMGVIPGLGTVTALAILVPLTFGMEPLLAFMVLAATQGGGNFGGSITSILFNTPGMASNAATLLDGYPMARQGRAGEALGASAMASALGAIIGLAILALSIPVMIDVLLLFGSPETFWLGMWGVMLVAVVVRGNVLAGLISAALGAVFAMHGRAQVTGDLRWYYDLTFMMDGFKLIPALVGLFAIAEMIRLVSEGGSIAGEEAVEIRGGQWNGAKAVIAHKWLFVRSAIIGVLIGIIPGVGGSVANFVSYLQAVTSEPDSDRFGTGDIRGVIASEASNDAKDGGAFIPTLGFGIPGSASMAVLLGAFIFHGIVPGPRLYQTNLDIVGVIILSLLVSNVLTSTIGLSVANYLKRVTQIEVEILAPMILMVAFIGVYALNNNVYDLYIAILFGLFGFALKSLEISPVPFIISFLLTPVVETNFFRSLQISNNDFTVFVDSTVSAILLVLTVSTVLVPYLKPLLGRAVIDR